MAKAIMIQGTGSHVGKSIITAGLCRIFRNMGYRVAPFKAQNMALNSAVAKEGGEIGRAQAIQAEACGIEPSIHMNPVLLKPNSDMGSQVIIHGKVVGNMKAREYYAFKEKAWEAVCESYERLSMEFDLIVIEGAGSPAEVNLKENDIVNMKVAEMANAPVILVSDIDRGGVFASLIGTMELLTPSERKMVCGFIINKFRGDKTLLEPGLEFIEKRTGVPILGVVPYFMDMGIGEEDSVGLGKREVRGQGSGVSRVGCAQQIKIGIIRLSHISNYTDFDPLQREPDVQLSYIQRPEELAGLDVVIIPGSKNTIDDLILLKKIGFAEAIRGHYKRRGRVVGICGGYQILGIKVSDPYGVETEGTSEDGLELLQVETILLKDKITANVEAIPHPPSLIPHPLLRGYEIHMGESKLTGDAEPLFVIKKRNGDAVEIPDGAVTKDGRCWGTYIHGIFDNDHFRKEFLNSIRKEKSFAPLDIKVGIENVYDNLAHLLDSNLDIFKMMGFAGLTNTPGRVRLSTVKENAWSKTA
ncbi:MAG: cobyric acid synthase [Deltaproteobacteria bacterium]|nr:cobyric acid synthase [Deltaproteobacteria bacterium]